MPSIVFCLSSPSVLLTIGSSRILAACCSVASSQEYAVISSPVFVLIVTWLSLSLVVGGSAVSVGRGGGCDDSLVRCCW